MGDEDALLFRRQREDFLVVKSLKLWLLVEGACVMTFSTEAPADPRPGYVRIQQQAH